MYSAPTAAGVAVVGFADHRYGVRLTPQMRRSRARARAQARRDGTVAAVRQQQRQQLQGLYVQHQQQQAARRARNAG